MEDKLIELRKKIVDAIICDSPCPKCKGTLLGLHINTVVECNACHKLFQRFSIQDGTYYTELVLSQ